MEGKSELEETAITKDKEYSSHLINEKNQITEQLRSLETTLKIKQTEFEELLQEEQKALGTQTQYAI